MKTDSTISTSPARVDATALREGKTTVVTESRGDTADVWFLCRATTARGVFVSGTFNEWHPALFPLDRDDTGLWSGWIELAPGHYEFRFVVDGAWTCEPACRGGAFHGCSRCVPNEFGTMNRRLEIS